MNPRLAALFLPMAIFGCASSAVPAGEPEEQGVFATRILYAPGHFGNSYEVMGEGEMRACLEEASHWGFNGYADWFDTVDCSDPFASPHCNLGTALWDRKKAHFQTAQALKLPCYLLITPNHVYLDQCRPDLEATKTNRIFGQLICPSKPEARAIILKNYENLFADLAKAGVKLRGLSAGPYDYGGCACEACQPWILTFAALCREVHALAERRHPGLEMHFIGWWWSEEEHRLFAEWADREAPGWAKSIALHIPYGKVDVSKAPLPKGCERHAFVHIGYAEAASPRDMYGHLGPVIAAERLEHTVAALAKHGCTGVVAYSEGVYEDVNKALLGGLASGRFRSADAVLEAYAMRYFESGDRTAPRWAAWLRAWGQPYAVDVKAAIAELRKLYGTNPAPSWRLAQWEAKARLMQCHAAIGNGAEWPEERLAAVEAFWREQEQMHREIYGLGPLRHILNRRFSPFPWYKGWAAHKAQSAGTRMGEE